MREFSRASKILLGLGLILLIMSFIIVTIGFSFLIASWMTDRYLEDIFTYFSDTKLEYYQSEKFENIFTIIDNGSNGMSAIRALSLISLYIGFPFFMLMLFLTIPERRELDRIYPESKTILDLSPTSFTIIFSILFAIALLFGASANEIILENKNSFFILSLLVADNSIESDAMIGIIEDQIISTSLNYFLYVLHGSCLALIGFLFFFARILPILTSKKKDKENNTLSRSLVLIASTIFFLWMLFFVLMIGYPTEGIVQIDIPNPLENPIEE